MAKKHKTLTRRKGGSVALRTKTLLDGRRSLRLDIYQPGDGDQPAKRTIETLGLYLDGGPDDTETLAEAERLHVERLSELQQGSLGVKARRRRGVLEFYRSLAEVRKTKVWRASMKAFEQFTLATQQIPWQFAQMTAERCDQYRLWLLASKLKRNSSSEYFAKFRQMLRQAAREGLVDLAILELIGSIKREEAAVEYLTIEEVRLLARTHCGNPHVKRAFLFRCYTGLRDSDVRLLDRRRIVDTETGPDGRPGQQLVFRQHKVRHKGGMEYLPLSEQARAILDECEPDAEGRLFPLPTLKAELGVLKTWAKRAKITKHVTTHVARHTFATLAITYGGDLYVVSTLLGHSDITTTTIYAKVVGEKKRQTVALIPGLNGEESPEV